MVIKFDQLGCGVGGVLINDRRGLVGVVHVPGALQEKLEPIFAHVVLLFRQFFNSQ